MYLWKQDSDRRLRSAESLVPFSGHSRRPKYPQWLFVIYTRQHDALKTLVQWKSTQTMLLRATHVVNANAAAAHPDRDTDGTSGLVAGGDPAICEAAACRTITRWSSAGVMHQPGPWSVCMTAGAGAAGVRCHDPVG